MTENFNIRDNNWDSLYLHYSTHTDTLRELASSFSLELSMLVNQVPNYYIDNIQDLILDLMFLWANVEEFNNHTILLDLQGPSNHTSLSVYIIIEEEFIHKKK